MGQAAYCQSSCTENITGTNKNDLKKKPICSLYNSKYGYASQHYVFAAQVPFLN